MISASPLAAATQASAYSQTVSMSGGTGPFTWSIASGSLPAGLSLDSYSGVISGTPTVTGTSNFIVQVTDANSATDIQALSIVVNPVAPVISTTLLANATQASSYSKTLTVSGGVSPFTWSVVSGTLPAGLSLNSSTGVVSGIPTVQGTSIFTVQVTDAALATDTQALSILVNAVPVITSSTLPDATQASVYNQVLTLSGGTGPFSWSVASGSLPAGRDPGK